MILTRADAAASLSDIAAAETKSLTLRGYQSFAPHLIIWGVAWAFAYSINDLAPNWAGAAWIAIVTVAVTGDIIAARLDRKGSANAMFAFGLFVIFAVYVVGTLAILAPKDPRQAGAFIPMLVAASYAVLGLMKAPRMLVLGASLAALTLFGFFALPAHFLLWMAAVGGGSLILGGIWLRQA